MAVEVDIKISGLNEALAILRKMPDRVRTRVLRGAVRAGATVMRRQVRANAPRGDEPSPASEKYGRLRDNIRIIRLKRGPKTWAGYRVDTGDAYWGYFIEFGTVKMAPRAWFRPAVDTAAEASLARMRDQMGRSIEREAAKLAREHPTRAR